MKTDKEIVGTLLGFDDFVSILSALWFCGFTSLLYFSSCLPTPVDVLIKCHVWSVTPVCSVTTIFLTHCLRYGLGRCDRIVSTRPIFPSKLWVCCHSVNVCLSEVTPEGRRITKLDQILLNGNNITMVRETIFWLLLPLRSPNKSLLFCSSSREEKVLKYEGGCNLRSAL